MNLKGFLKFLFILTLIIFIIGLFMPFYKIETWINSETFSFLILLSALGILYIISDNPSIFERIQTLKLGASGLELHLFQAQKELMQEEKEAVTEKVKDEIIEIREKSENLLNTFILIDNKINEKIQNLAKANNIKWRGNIYTARSLLNINQFNQTIYALIEEFRHIRNEIINNYDKIPKNQIDLAIEIGELIISRLSIIYIQDIPEEQATDFIQRLEIKYPNLKYEKGSSRSSIPGNIGIYYKIIDID